MHASRQAGLDVAQDVAHLLAMHRTTLAALSDLLALCRNAQEQLQATAQAPRLPSVAKAYQRDVRLLARVERKVYFFVVWWHEQVEGTLAALRISVRQCLSEMDLTRPSPTTATTRTQTAAVAALARASGAVPRPQDAATAGETHRRALIRELSSETRE